jgi:hypothetical protein
MWGFKKRRPEIPETWRLPFHKWTDEDVAAMSSVIRRHGQPDSPGFRRQALVALNTIRSDAVVELIARAMTESSNPGMDVDRVILGSHYMSHLPFWMSFLEYAYPTVTAVAEAYSLSVRRLESVQTGEWADISSAPKNGTKIDLLYPYPRGRTIDCYWEPAQNRGWVWREPRWGDGGLLPEDQWSVANYPNGTPTHWRYPPALPERPSGPEGGN